ncbi:MAG TPA: class I SAM-dependent methyltransferase [Vicinamibacterales bacterium]|jgi:SAM-dependent methyltransferase
MSFEASTKSIPESGPAAPDWLRDVLRTDSLEEGKTFQAQGQTFVVRNGIPRSQNVGSAAQAQTGETFGFKWKKRDAFESAASRARHHRWLIERYGDVATAPWLAEHGDRPLLVDAGCGAGWSALELLGPLIPRLRYLGVDVSEAVDVARQRFEERGLNAGFLQTDINDLPLPENSVDLIFSEGVLHHTNSTERALTSLARLLRRGGRFLFYVYRRKGPVREFTDDYIRAKLQAMTPEEAWHAMGPLTKLGISLGELDAEIDVPEAIDLLGIPAGRINVQRLFYWHIAKVFYGPELSFDEMNHINFDWYAPANAHRQSPEEVRRWCAQAGLTLEHEVVEEAGITVIARKG